MPLCGVVLNPLRTLCAFLFFLLQVLFSACATAAEPLIINCHYGDRVRVIEVAYPEQTVLPCEVNYRKNDVVKTLWRASKSEGYCVARAREFALKQESWGWDCSDEEIVVEEPSLEVAVRDLDEVVQVSLYDDSTSLQSAAEASKQQQSIESQEPVPSQDGQKEGPLPVAPPDDRLIKYQKILPPSYWVGAAFQYDSSHFDGLFNAADGGGKEVEHGFRRLELSVRKQVGDWGEAKAQLDLEGKKVKDLYFRYIGNDVDSRLTLGNQKEPLSLDNLTSSKFSSASEVALSTSAFVLPRTLGVQYNVLNDDVLWGVGMFTGTLGETFDTSDDFQRAFSGRVSKGFSWFDDTDVHLGLGLSLRHGQFDQLTVQAETHWSDRLKVLDFDAQDSRITNVELAFNHLGLGFQGEWFGGVYDGDNGGHAQGYYLQASYALGDRHRNYRPQFGVFGPVGVKKYDWLAFEFFARYSSLRAENDLDDANRVAAKGVGVNWFPGNRVRFSLEWGHADSGELVGGFDEGRRVNGRMQFLY